MKIVKAVFFGTPNFSKNILESLVKDPFLDKDQVKLDIVGIVSQPDKMKGRSSKTCYTPVKAWALENTGVEINQPEKVSSPEFIEYLKSLNADVFIVAAYGQIMRQTVLDIPRLGAINVHTSLLPKLRGAAPISRCIMNGDKLTGVTIMKMELKMDAGPICSQVLVPIEDDWTCSDLEHRLFEESVLPLKKVILDRFLGTFTEVIQDENQVTFAPKVELEDTFVDFNMPVKQIHNRIRGSTPEPGAWTICQISGESKRIRFRKTFISNLPMKQAGDIVRWDKSALYISCADGVLGVEELQLEGKGWLSSVQLLNGYKEKLSFQ